MTGVEWNVTVTGSFGIQPLDVTVNVPFGATWLVSTEMFPLPLPAVVVVVEPPAVVVVVEPRAVVVVEPPVVVVVPWVVVVVVGRVVVVVAWVVVVVACVVVVEPPAVVVVEPPVVVVVEPPVVVVVVVPPPPAYVSGALNQNVFGETLDWNCATSVHECVESHVSVWGS